MTRPRLRLFFCYLVTFVFVYAENRQTLTVVSPLVMDRGTTPRSKSSRVSEPVKEEFELVREEQTIASIIEENTSKKDGMQIIFPNNCKFSTERKRIANSRQPRIALGVDTRIGEFPWMARLEYEMEHGIVFLCGGSLITNWHVLTVAHCADERELRRRNLALYSVTLGEWDTTSDPDCSEGLNSFETSKKLQCAERFQTIRINKTYIHPKYKNSLTAQANDIALLQLSQQVEFNKFISPICLPQHGRVPSTAVISGWGQNEDFKKPNRLQKVTLSLSKRSECKFNYRRRGLTLYSHHLCFLGEAGEDSCVGDSGGPLMQIDDSGNDQLRQVHIIGLVSFGSRICGYDKIPGVYTKVYDYLSWIKCCLGMINATDCELESSPGSELIDPR